MSEVAIVIDDMEVKAKEGRRLIDVALEHGIFIPHLCHLPEIEDSYAGCRMCLVEVDGKARPVTSCTERVRPGMMVRTDTPMVRRLQRSALRLLLSAHHVDCGNCYANKRCALQDLSKRLGVKLKVKEMRDLCPRLPLDETLGHVLHDPNKCVHCGNCVRLSQRLGIGAFHFSRRGLKMRVSLFPSGASKEELERCMKVCPVGALIPAEFGKRQGDGIRKEIAKMSLME
jgi:bidirectional [NiFe] hydrogenase diaphorase subunit